MNLICRIQLEGTFELALKKELGLDIKHMEMDGSCLFRAIGKQIYLLVFDCGAHAPVTDFSN